MDIRQEEEVTMPISSFSLRHSYFFQETNQITQLQGAPDAAAKEEGEGISPYAVFPVFGLAVMCGAYMAPIQPYLVRSSFHHQVCPDLVISSNATASNSSGYSVEASQDRLLLYRSTAVVGCYLMAGNQPQGHLLFRWFTLGRDTLGYARQAPTLLLAVTLLRCLFADCKPSGRVDVF
eukprot:750130-Hanusia_phi.AAC.12